MPLAGRVTTVVVGAKPRATCFACLAKVEGLSEPDVRDAAQVAVFRDERLRVVRERCDRCGLVVDGLMAREDAPAR